MWAKLKFFEEPRNTALYLYNKDTYSDVTHHTISTIIYTLKTEYSLVGNYLITAIFFDRVLLDMFLLFFWSIPTNRFYSKCMRRIIIIGFVSWPTYVIKLFLKYPIIPLSPTLVKSRFVKKTYTGLYIFRYTSCTFCLNGEPYINSLWLICLK